MIKKLLFLLCVAGLAMAAQAAENDSITCPIEGYELVWHDEFCGDSLSADWEHVVWPKGRVNHELQEYVRISTPGGRTVTEVSGGALHQTAYREKGNIYSSRLNAMRNSGWQYGYFEARIRLPKGKGTWPAFWMMPVNGKHWPNDGEIDILEEVGCNPDVVTSSLHAEGHVHIRNTQVTKEIPYPGAEGEYHVYSMLWTADNISTFVDGKPILSYDNPGTGKIDWPYDAPFYIILNLAWGGDWGGMHGVDNKALPVTMDVDYVRVWQPAQKKNVLQQAFERTADESPVLKEIEVKEITYAGITRQYALYLPKDNDGNVIKNAPLVVWNHGGGEYNIDIQRSLRANEGVTGWIDRGYECAVLMLQVANENYSYGAAAFEDRKMLIDRNNAVQAEIIRNLIADGSVDADRVYITGASSGGGATMRFLIQFPEMVAAALPICSMDPIVMVHNNSWAALQNYTREQGGDPQQIIPDSPDVLIDKFEKAFQSEVYTWDEKKQAMVKKPINTKALIQTPIFFLHAESDMVCQSTSSKVMYAALNRLGAKHNRIKIYSDADMHAYPKTDTFPKEWFGVACHFSYDKMLYENDTPMPWLFSQKR